MADILPHPSHLSRMKESAQPAELQNCSRTCAKSISAPAHLNPPARRTGANSGERQFKKLSTIPKAMQEVFGGLVHHKCHRIGRDRPRFACDHATALEPSRLSIVAKSRLHSKCSEQGF